MDVSTFGFWFVVGPYTYNSTPSFGNPDSATGVIFLRNDDPGGLRLVLNFESSLAGPGGMVAILPTSAESAYAPLFTRVITQGYVSATVVPLPATVWLVGSALLGLGVVKRKKA